MYIMSFPSMLGAHSRSAREVTAAFRIRGFFCIWRRRMKCVRYSKRRKEAMTRVDEYDGDDLPMLIECFVSKRM